MNKPISFHIIKVGNQPRVYWLKSIKTCLSDVVFTSLMITPNIETERSDNEINIINFASWQEKQ